MKALRKYLLAALALFAGAGIVLFPGELSEAVRGSVGGCLEVVIPALFAFTVLAVYLQRSGLYRVILKPLTVPLSKLLRLPEELCAVFLLSNIGGYPVGAKLLTGLVRSGRLRRGDASRLLCCCYGSGPSFVIGTAGMQVSAARRVQVWRRVSKNTGKNNSFMCCQVDSLTAEKPAAKTLLPLQP